MRIAMYGNGSGSQYWRLVDPAYLLNERGFDVKFPQGGIKEPTLRTADVVVLEGCVDKEGIALCYMLQQEQGLKIVVDQDDDVKVEADNPHAKEHEFYQAYEVVTKTLEIADMVTTTTPYLAEKLKKINKNVVVLPNYMRKQRWDLNKRYGKNDKVRIGWVGSTTHLKDLELIKPIISNILRDYKDMVEFIFLGDPRISGLLGLPVEVVVGVPFDFYPAKLHGLNLDIGLAPLLDSEFNRNKSGIKVLEYGICGVPCVASAVEPYLPFKDIASLARTITEFEAHLRSLIENPALRSTQGADAKKAVLENYMLDNHIESWVEAYKGLVYDKVVDQGETKQTRS